MLIELRIRNFAIIDSLAVRPGPGLNIFTGETGAGKSIIIDALSLVLGDRARSEIIRTDAPEAEVEALFDVSGVEGIGPILEDAGIEATGELVIKRVVQREGRNRIYINGSLATLVTLTAVGSRLIDIYGQSEHQSLTRVEEHIEVLDTFGGLSGIRREMAAAYRAYFALKKERDSLLGGEDASEKIKGLESMTREIEDAAPRVGEEEALQAEKERLKNAARIKSAVIGSEAALYSDTGSIVERLGRVVRELKAVAGYDERLKGVVSALESGLCQTEDAAITLRDMKDSLDFDPARLDEIETRLFLLSDLRKKYGPAIADVLKKKEEMEREIEALKGLKERAEKIEEELAAARTKALEVAGRLSEARKVAAEKLKAAVESALAGLGMEGAVFEVIIESETERGPSQALKFGEKGSDRVSFYISPNPGEEVKPLAHIASGGELSRIMLAIKYVTAAGRVPTLVFDEIDSGVGGAMGQVVGTRLKGVARTGQVLCITHLPQIAAFADKLFAVKKAVNEEKRTVASIRELAEGEAIEQIAWMLGGREVTDTTRKHAMELVLAAKNMASGEDG